MTRMNDEREQRIEQYAEKARKRILDVWHGDAKRADEFLCSIMRWYKDNSADVTPEDRDRILKMMAQLIQR